MQFSCCIFYNVLAVFSLFGKFYIALWFLQHNMQNKYNFTYQKNQI